MSKVESVSIGDIRNFYGGLSIKKADGKMYWSIENHGGDSWDEIPQYLYDALLRFENERLKPPED